jgi:hypothetical protein
MARIQDGEGAGKWAGVDKNNRLKTASLITSVQHEISHNDEEAFQVWTEQAIGTSDVTILTLTNTSTSKDIIVTYIRVHTVGAAATNTAAYFSILVGGAYASGGTAVTPTNMHVDSANASSSTSFDSTGTAITMSGTPVVVDKMHEAEAEVFYQKEGSLILPKNSTLSIKHKGSTIAGNAYTRISYYFDTKE